MYESVWVMMAPCQSKVNKFLVHVIWSEMLCPVECWIHCFDGREGTFSFECTLMWMSLTVLSSERIAQSRATLPIIHQLWKPSQSIKLYHKEWSKFRNSITRATTISKLYISSACSFRSCLHVLWNSLSMWIIICYCESALLHRDFFVSEIFMILWRWRITGQLISVTFWIIFLAISKGSCKE